MDHLSFESIIDILNYLDARKLHVYKSCRVLHMLRFLSQLQLCTVENVLNLDQIKTKQFCVTQILTNTGFDEPINHKVKFSFRHVFNYKIGKTRLPPNLTCFRYHATTSKMYAQMQLSELPKLLSYAVINTFTSAHLIDHLPPKLLFLTLYNPYNKIIDHLPSTLKYLCTGATFNQPINNLPQSLQRLILGSSFDQPINFLPDNLTHLIILSSYTHVINTLPNKLKKLYLGYDHYIQKLIVPTFHFKNFDFKTTPHLNCIQYNFSNSKFIYYNLDQSFTIEGTTNFKISHDKKKIHFGTLCTKILSPLPEGITHIYNHGGNTDFDQIYQYDLPKSLIYFYQLKNSPIITNLPNLKFLKIHYSLDNDLSQLPASLEYLVFAFGFNYSVDNLIIITPKLKYIDFGYNFNKPIKELPSSLVFMKIRARFNNVIEKFPESLQILILGDAVIINDILPPSLLKFSFTCGLFDLSKLPNLLWLETSEFFRITHVPKSLIHLKTSRPFKMSQIPKTLRYINCQSSNEDQIPKWVTKVVLHQEN